MQRLYRIEFVGHRITRMAKPTSTTPAATPTSGLSEFIRTIIFAGLLAFGIRTLAFEPFNIPSGSMMPGLQIGDFLFVSKYSYGYSSMASAFNLVPVAGRVGGHLPERGDVIVFKPAPDPSMDFIKRLIGLPGDVIEVKAGTIILNGKPVTRERIGPVMFEDRGGETLRPAIEYKETIAAGVSYVTYQEYDNGPLDNFGPTTVPPGHYFFMGDNRNNSQDSRTNRVGFVPWENLVGKARLTWFSLTADARFWQVWKWPYAIRWERMFHTIQ
jgi:signal peptidase I